MNKSKRGSQICTSLGKIHTLLKCREDFSNNYKYYISPEHKHILGILGAYEDAIDHEIRTYIDLKDNE